MWALPLALQAQLAVDWAVRQAGWVAQWQRFDFALFVVAGHFLLRAASGRFFVELFVEHAAALVWAIRLTLR
jgi:hypothetical protein